MKLVDVVSLTKKAIAQTMGDEYMSQQGGLDDLASYKLVDVGSDIEHADAWSAWAINAVSLLGKHIIEDRAYTSRLPELYIDSFDWGGFLERTRFGLGDVMTDPMYTLTAGTSYADIEHTYYDVSADTKIYAEAKAIMTPLSIVKEQLKEAFRSWEDMNKWLSGKRMAITNTINIALMVYEKMLISCGIAISDLKTGTARHLVSEMVDANMLSVSSIGGSSINIGNVQQLSKDDLLKLCEYTAKEIGKTRSYMREVSSAFNDGSVPTWSNDEPRLILLDAYERMNRFFLRAGTYNKDDVSFGEYNTVAAWQAVNDGGNPAKLFDDVTVSTVNISADANEKLGIGKNEYTQDSVIGLMYDFKAMGISLMRNKVTSQYTACADFWNEFSHVLVNYLIDSSYGMVAFMWD